MRPRLCWAPTGRELLGAICGVKGQTLDPDLYLSLLGDRVQIMADNSEAWELEQLEDLLREAGLLDQPFPVDWKRAGREIVEDNLEVALVLRQRGIPGRMPPTIEANDLRAQEALQGTNLTEWVHALVSGRIERG
jgi:hypothetical protein